jgi:hypothetical protein
MGRIKYQCSGEEKPTQLSERCVGAGEGGLKEEAMKSIYYSAAWTECGFLLGCSHEHETIVEANSCIPCAGGYVVGVENGVMRSLTAEEESEFQRAHDAPRNDKPPLDAILPAPAEAAVSDSRYAIMTRIKVGDRWTWATWMCFQTYAQAAAHAREGNKVVRFRSPEWVALRQQREVAPPLVINALRSEGEDETFVETVLRLLDAYGLDQHAEPISYVRHGLINTDMIDLVLSRLKRIGNIRA